MSTVKKEAATVFLAAKRVAVTGSARTRGARREQRPSRLGDRGYEVVVINLDASDR